MPTPEQKGWKAPRHVASRRVVPRQLCSLDQTPKYTFPLLFDRFIARAQSGGYVTRLRLLCAQSSRKQERQEGRWNRLKIYRGETIARACTFSQSLDGGSNVPALAFGRRGERHA